jgi:DNA-binding transcriptional LysR family regulator
MDISFRRLMGGEPRRKRPSKAELRAADELELPPGISLDRLTAFCRVAAAGSVTLAAGGNASRQSQFSRQIKELESFFKTKLIERKGGGVVLTDAGEDLHRMAEAQILSLKRFRENQEVKPDKLCVLAPDFLINWLILPRVDKIRQIFPEARLNLSANQGGTMIQTYDQVYGVSLCWSDPDRKPDPQNELGTLRTALFVPKAAVPAIRDEAGIRGLAKLLTNEDVGRHPIVPVCIKDGKLSVGEVIELGSDLMQADMVAGGGFAAVLPMLAAQRLPDDRFWRFPLPKGNRFERRVTAHFTKDDFGLKRIPEPKAKLLMAALSF